MTTLHHGDCIEVMRRLPASSVDAIVTDPPYGLGFMGKEWDSLPPGLPWAQECLRALKPGGYLLAFGGTRTSHRLTCAIEDAGFEIRDSIAWLHSQGFPKGKSALKPGFEPITMARKPLIGTVAHNVTMHGTGALNIDGCRVATEDRFGGGGSTNGSPFAAEYELGTGFREGSALGRWPANVTLDEGAAAELDEQSGVMRPGGGIAAGTNAAAATRFNEVYGTEKRGRGEWIGYGDSGGASRFFYVAKAPKRERVALDGVAHPTVKPLTLMRWLVRLVTPPGGTVLEPFAGSGTTVEACLLEGFDCIAIEREASYLPLIQARIDRSAMPSGSNLDVQDAS